MSSSPEGNVMPAVRYPDSITLAFSHVFRAKRTDGDPHTATATCTRVQLPLAALHLPDAPFRFSPSTPGDLRLPAGVKMTLAAAAAATALLSTGLPRLSSSSSTTTPSHNLVLRRPHRSFPTQKLWRDLDMFCTARASFLSRQAILT